MSAALGLEAAGIQHAQGRTWPKQDMTLGCYREGNMTCEQSLKSGIP